MDLRTLQAQWTLEMVPPEQMPDHATDLLVRGIESPAVIELAGMVRPSFWEVSPVVERAFREAGLPALSREEALWRVAYATARSILDDLTAPREGATLLWQICNELDMPEPLRYFVYLAADYGEGPGTPEEEAAWFDTRIRETAQELLTAMPADGESPPRVVV
jgi:hypothetical protein